jgi:hypothetical protein
MPLYDYFCPANQCTVEVGHRMHEDIRTWAELVAAAGIDAGDTPPGSEVRRIITGGSVLKASSGEARAQAPCGALCACHGGSA